MPPCERSALSPKAEVLAPLNDVSFGPDSGRCSTQRQVGKVPLPGGLPAELLCKKTSNYRVAFDRIASRNIISNFLRQKGPIAIVAVDAAASGEPRDGRAGRTVSLLIWGVSSPIFKKFLFPPDPNQRVGRNSESVFRHFRLTIGAIRSRYCALRAGATGWEA